MRQTIFFFLFVVSMMRFAYCMSVSIVYCLLWQSKWMKFCLWVNLIWNNNNLMVNFRVGSSMWLYILWFASISIFSPPAVCLVMISRFHEGKRNYFARPLKAAQWVRKLLPRLFYLPFLFSRFFLTIFWTRLSFSLFFFFLLQFFFHLAQCEVFNSSALGHKVHKLHRRTAFILLHRRKNTRKTTLTL